MAPIPADPIPGRVHRLDRPGHPRHGWECVVIRESINGPTVMFPDGAVGYFLARDLAPLEAPPGRGD